MCGWHSGILSVGIRGDGNIFPRSAPAATGAPRRREPVETSRPTITLEQSERKGFEIPDDALEIPDFLK